MSPSIRMIGLELYEAIKQVDVPPTPGNTFYEVARGSSREEKRSILLDALLPFCANIKTWPSQFEGHKLSSYLFDKAFLSSRPKPGGGTTDTPRKGNWGPNVRHIKLLEVDIGTLVVDDIHPADGNFDHLTVLSMIPSPTPIISYPFFEISLADKILESQLPSLRIVVIGKHKFWLEFPETGSGGIRRVWWLSDAMRDRGQERAMEACLSRADWAFFDPPYGSETMRTPYNIVLVKKAEKGDGWNSK
ncbi:hypothetical protein MMC30_005859 [Trapelia coarctata]|nr:hypothetical protein [Trapelia coarctata]